MLVLGNIEADKPVPNGQANIDRFIGVGRKFLVGLMNRLDQGSKRLGANFRFLHHTSQLTQFLSNLGQITFACIADSPTSLHFSLFKNKV